MAFDMSALSAYVEQDKFAILSQMQATGGLAGVVDIQTGIREVAALHYFDTDLIFQADGCTSSPNMTTSFLTKNITVGAIKWEENLCTKTLNGFWEQTKVREGAAGEEEVPAEIEKLWMDKKINLVKVALAKADFQGDSLSATVNLTFYEGLLKQIDADAYAGVILGNTGAVNSVTTSNIIAVLQAMWLAISEDMRSDTDTLSLWMPQSYYDMYIVALINANQFHYKGEDGFTKLYGTTLTLRPTIGLSGVDRMVLTGNSNIVIGMDAQSDEDNVKAWFSNDSNINRFRSSFKRGITFRYANRIVEFSFANS